MYRGVREVGKLAKKKNNSNNNNNNNNNNKNATIFSQYGQ